MQALPPYVSWSAFIRTLDGFGDLLPDTRKSESMAGLSLSLASPMLQAFRFLRLVASNGKATPDLRFLASHPESRAAVLTKVFRQAYPEPFTQSAGPVSEKALGDLMARTGLLAIKMNTAQHPRPAGAQLESGSSTGLPISAMKSLSLELTSGGTIEIGIDIDLLRLGKADREFVFDLIDKVRPYRDPRRQEQDRDMESGDNRQAISRGHEEVPF